MNLFIAFGAGLASFLSPCVLPLIPSYLSYITGLSVEELSRDASARKSLRQVSLHAILFIVGFSAVFMILGASASALGKLFLQYQTGVRRAGGVLILFLGAYLAGFLKVGFLSREKKLSLPNHPTGWFGSFFVGAIFAFGWTPCVGPILGSILVLAGASQSLREGLLYLSVYSLGLGLPFFLSALAMNGFLSSFQRIKRYLHGIEVTSGLLLMAIGVALVTNTFVRLTYFLNQALSPLVRFFNL